MSHTSYTICVIFMSAFVNNERTRKHGILKLPVICYLGTISYILEEERYQYVKSYKKKGKSNVIKLSHLDTRWHTHSVNSYNILYNGVTTLYVHAQSKIVTEIN